MVRRPAPALRVPPVALVLIGIASVQAGAGLAKTLFDDVSPTTLVWLRLATSALVLLAAVRPRLRGRTREDWLVVLGFGLSLGVMNWAIYQSFARIPLGVAVTIEFAGPLSVALLGSRRARDLAWVGLAAVGVVLLGVEPTALDPVGVLFALLAAAAWAAYIGLSSATGRRWEGLDGLALASAVGTVVASVLLGVEGGDAPWAGAHVVLIGAAVGLLSSVVPYSCELVALRRLKPSVFGVLMSLEPAAAALAGLVVVGELLSGWQWAAVACVVVASAGATRSASRGSPDRHPAPLAATTPDP